MRIVLDTNVLVSALIMKRTPPGLLYQARDAGSFELVTSGAQLDELTRVFAYQKLRPFITQDEAEALVETIGPRHSSSRSSPPSTCRRTRTTTRPWRRRSPARRTCW